MKRASIGRLLLAGATALAFMSAAAKAEDSELTVFDWSGYEDPAFHPDYVEKYGNSPTFTFFGDEEEAFNKLRAGFSADVAHPCSQSIPKWRDADLLEPIDTSRIKEWNDMLPGIKAMKDFMTDEKGTAWVVPFEWGNTAMTYRTDKIKAEDVTSLQAFADPKYEGRVSVGDNVDDAYALASLAIGLKDWTKMTDEQFQQASDFLRKVHKNIRLYWTDTTEIVNALSNNEVDLAWTWNDAAVQTAANGVPVAMNRDTKEGLSTWVCGYVILKGGKGNRDKLYDYLNAVDAPNVTEYLLTEWGYGHAIADGMAAIDPETLKESGYGDVASFVDKTLFQSPMPVELRQKMIAEFEKIKSGY